MRCITSVRFSMLADVLRWEGIEAPTADDAAQGIVWETYQDPITGEVRNEWVPGTKDDPTTAGKDEYSPMRTIPCIARGVVDGGIRVAGSTENFGDTYQNIEFAKLWTTARIKLTKRDRITNIRTQRGGSNIWMEDDGSPVIFNVNGISPLFDAFNKHVENFVLLERA